VSEILHSKPWITAADTLAVSTVLETGMIAQGQKTSQFEDAVARWVGAAGGVAVGSGSAAIVLALKALGIRFGDEVVMPSYVCPKVMEAVLTVGAEPVLCDIGEDWTIRPEHIESRLTGRTRAAIVPHLYGILADMHAFRRLPVPVIEDCAQALGPQRSWPLTRGDIAIFSFHPTKLLTTGEGGLAAAVDPELVARMRSLRDGTGESDRPRLFSPLTDMAATLGLSQLARYPEALERRKRIAEHYHEALEHIVPKQSGGEPFARSIFFRYPLKLRGGIAKFRPLFAAKRIRVSNGVDTLLHRMRGLEDKAFKTSVELFQTTVSLPIYPALTQEELEWCAKAAAEILLTHYDGAESPAS
jgi:UDP-4-amino-4-deoxy-L-arabinose-oxoglutarate aminotransferase